MRRFILVAVIAGGAGCTSDQTMRMDGVTPGAGDAMAANTAMQMVDPWQSGVNDTVLLVPAVRAAAAAEAASSGKAEPAAESKSSDAADD